MAKKITDLTILDEFKNGGVIYGFYWCKFGGIYRVITRNGDNFKTLIHLTDKDDLLAIRDTAKLELLEAIEKAKES